MPEKTPAPLLLVLAIVGVAVPARAGAGPVVDLHVPPEGSATWARACSVRYPLCVLGDHATSGTAILTALASADRAWATTTEALGLPAPEPAGATWDLYLVDAVDGGSMAVAFDRDPIRKLDRASSFGLLDRHLEAGCRLDLSVARAIVRGAMWAVVPATDEGSARAESQMLASIAAPCGAAADDDGVFQDQPERTVIDPLSTDFDRGAAMFFDWLDANFSTRPGALISGIWSLSPTVTPATAATWNGTPNAFDVLGISLKGALAEDSTFDDVLVRFSIHRALSNPPAHVAWHVPWPAQARRFASPVPVAPTGASYVVVDLKGAPANASLRVEAEWENFGRMRWDVVKLDPEGREMADVAVTSLPLGTTASMTVEALDGVDRLLIVGVDVGSTEHPFDPDQGWWEPHGWLLTVEGE